MPGDSLGLSLGFQSSSTVAADNSGIQILGGGIQNGLSNSGNSASTSPTSSQSLSTPVGNSTPAIGSPTAQPSPSLLAVPQSSIMSYLPLIVLGLLGLMIWKRG